MTVSKLFILSLAAAAAAHADFSYTTTTKGPMMPGANMDQTSKHYLKGDKMMTDMGKSAMIIDFDAQTVTHIDKANKTYSVSKVSDLTGQAQKRKPSCPPISRRPDSTKRSMASTPAKP